MRGSVMEDAIADDVNNTSKSVFMTTPILAETTASISELKRDPMGTVSAGEGFPVAILNRNQPVFYCVPAKTYEVLMNKLEDMELNAVTDARKGQVVIKVRLDAL